MAAIKSYSDLQQSRKLAEILPLESADMCWFEGEPFVEAVTGYEEERAESHRQAGMEMYPCWSLAALLSVLPNGKDVSTTLSRGSWKIEPVEYIDKWFCEYEDDTHTKDFSVSADNPIDACYELILNLHKLKML